MPRSCTHSFKMNGFIVLVFVLCAALSAAFGQLNDKSPVVTLKDYYDSLTSTQSRIISGKPAEVGQFPYQVAVLVDRSFCGGSLISNEWVLTAAHCAKGYGSFTLYLGRITLNNPEAGSIVVTSSRTIVHPRYNNFLHNDVALIRLPQPISFTNRIQAVGLPRRGQTLGAGLRVRVSGWGKISDTTQNTSNVLMWVDLTTITNAECMRVYGFITIISSTLCARGNPQHSTCNGDSGGPLVQIGSNNVATQVGVVSFVHRSGCASRNPSGYVRTEAMLSWIAQSTGLNV